MMPAFSNLLLLGAEAAGYGVGSGRIQGGWEYVWASYIITWVAVSSYAFSLWRRRKQNDTEPLPSGRDVGRNAFEDQSP